MNASIRDAITFTHLGNSAKNPISNRIKATINPMHGNACFPGRRAQSRPSGSNVARPFTRRDFAIPAPGILVNATERALEQDFELQCDAKLARHPDPDQLRACNGTPSSGVATPCSRRLALPGLQDVPAPRHRERPHSDNDFPFTNEHAAFACAFVAEANALWAHVPPININSILPVAHFKQQEKRNSVGQIFLAN